MKYAFKELPMFERDRDRYISDESLRELQLHLEQNPRSGSVIPGTPGLRKIRLPDIKRQKGKRGGLRVLYHVSEARSLIILFMIYSKGEADGLSSEQLKVINGLWNHFTMD